MKNKHLTNAKKTLSVFLAVLMLMSAWVFVAPAEVEAAVMYNMGTVNGASEQDMYFKVIRPGASDYVQVKYPSKMYLDINENLADVGYSVNISTNFGNGSNYTLVVFPNLWGGQEFNEGGSGGNQHSSLKGMTTLVDAFTDFGIKNGDLPGYFGNYSLDSNDNTVFQTTNPVNEVGTSGFNASYSGQPNKTGTFTYDIGSVSADPMYARFQKTNYSKYDDASYKSTSGHSGTPTKITVYVYDKSKLNDYYNTSTTYYNNNSSYSSYAVGSTWSDFISARSNAASTLPTRKVTHETVDSHEKAMNNANTNLRFAASNTALKNKVVEAQKLQQKAGYTTLYTEASRNAIALALENVTSNSLYSSVTEYKASAYTNAGAKAAADQSSINTLISSIDTAINGLERKYDVGYENLFSLTDWAINPTKANMSNGTIDIDVEKGTIKIVHDGSTAGTDNNTSQGTSYYKAAVEGDTEYVMTWKTEGSGRGQIHVFYTTDDAWTYTVNSDYSSGSQWFVNNGDLPYSSNMGEHTVTFKTLPETDGLVFRFGTCNSGDAVTFSDIRLVKKSDYDEGAKDYYYVREPFFAGEAKELWTPTKDGYVFDGWTLADGTAIETTEGLDASTTVYANWTKLHTVTYYDGDKTTILAKVTVKDGETIGAFPTVTPTKESDATNSYEFDYWYNATAMEELTVNTVVKSDIAVYTIFKAVPHSSFTFSLQKASTCDSNAIVTKKCADCSYNFGNVTYNPDEDANADSHTAWLAKGHDYSNRNEYIRIDGNDDQHAIKCAGYSTCGTTQFVDHTWDGNVSQGATCVTPGTIKKNCYCGAEKYVAGETDDTNHVNTKVINKKAPDCENDGYTGDTYCEDCKKTVATGTVDPKTGHSFTNYISNGDATCTADGTKTAKCDNCDATDVKIDTGSAKGHTWKDEGTDLYSAADCVNDAVYYQTCGICGISAKDDTTGTGSTWTDVDSKWNHDFTGDYVNNNDGTHDRKCINTGCTATGATADCTYGEWTKNSEETHSHTCELCGYTPAAEKHDWTKWTTADGATSDKAAQDTRYCTVCGRTETKDCDYKVTDRPETCTAPQLYTYTCNDCGHVYYVTGNKATGHDYTGTVKSYNNGQHNYLCANGCGTYGIDKTEGTRAACEYNYTNHKDGQHQATCKDCNYSFAQNCSGGQATCTAPAVCEKCKTAYGSTTAHSFTGTPVKLDGDKHAYLCVYCSTENLTGVGDVQGAAEDCSGGKATCSALAVCTVCGDTHGQLDADAHKYGKWTNIEGTERHERFCEYNDDHREESSCESSGQAIVDADCETAGYTLNTCDFCDHTWETNPVDALGHKWGAWNDNEDGTHTRTCEREGCHYADDHTAKTETDSCTKENAESEVKAPTCTEGGYTTYTCKDCGYEWTDDETLATGHSYAEKKKKTTAAYERSKKDCITDETYWYCCDNCDVSAETEKDEYENEADLYWVSEAAVGHKYDAKTATEAYLKDKATCTTKATYYYSCSVCGASSKGTAEVKTFESGAVLGHDWTDTETFKKSDADCVNNEVYYKECSCCHISSEGETDATWEKLNTLSGHDFDHDNDGVIGNEGDAGYTAGVDATCEDKGMTEHYTCETCGKHFNADQTKEIATDKLEIAALRHDYKDVSAKPATCEENGYTKHKQCQRENCGYRNSDYEVIPATGHEFKAENGYYSDTGYHYHAYKCSNCDAFGVDGVKYSVDASGLDPEIVGGIACSFTGEYVNYDDADGRHSHKLSCVCGNEQSAVCEDTDGAEYTAPECEKDGYYTYECSVCGYDWTETDEGTALEHDLQVKSNGNGTHSEACVRDGCDYAEAAEKCSTETPATACGTYDECDTCHEAFGTVKPHVFTNYVSDNNATCTVDGTKTAVCDTCVETEDNKKATDTVKDEGSKLGHEMTEYGYSVADWDFVPEDFDEVIAESTCCKEGKAISYCIRCSVYKTKTEKKDPSKHNWKTDANGLVWEAGEGDCSTGVIMTNKCVNEGCDAVQTRFETDVDHDYVLIVEELPTCKDEGSRHYKCSRCGDTYDEYYDEDADEPIADLAPTGEHQYEVISETAATCTKNAYVTEQCKVCKETRITETEGTMVEHEYYDVKAVAPTCEADGHSAYLKCADCGAEKDKITAVEDPDAYAAKGHDDTDGDGKCNECYRVLYESGEKSCGCICHKENFFMQFIYKILNFFWKLFKISKTCDCGAGHW